MEPKFQSSFIPKGPLTTSGSLASSQTKEKSLFGFLASIIFAIVVVLSILVFAYNLYLGYSIKKMGSQLDAARADIDQSSVTELTRLNTRIISTQNLLNKHSVLSPLFSFLEDSTLQTVRFTDFNYVDEGNGISLVMKGEARGYSAVSLQSDIFNKSKFLSDPIFSDLSLDDKGNVTFTFKATIDPSLVSFKKEVEASGTPASPVIVPTATSTATTTTSAATTTKSASSQATSTTQR